IESERLAEVAEEGSPWLAGERLRLQPVPFRALFEDDHRIRTGSSYGEPIPLERDAPAEVVDLAQRREDLADFTPSVRPGLVALEEVNRSVGNRAVGVDGLADGDSVAVDRERVAEEIAGRGVRRKELGDLHPSPSGRALVDVGRAE